VKQHAEEKPVRHGSGQTGKKDRERHVARTQIVPLLAG
jgi:hypothetical protein